MRMYIVLNRKNEFKGVYNIKDIVEFLENGYLTDNNFIKCIEKGAKWEYTISKVSLYETGKTGYIIEFPDGKITSVHEDLDFITDVVKLGIEIIGNPVEHSDKKVSKVLVDEIIKCNDKYCENTTIKSMSTNENLDILDDNVATAQVKNDDKTINISKWGIGDHCYAFRVKFDNKVCIEKSVVIDITAKKKERHEYTDKITEIFHTEKEAIEYAINYFNNYILGSDKK